MMQNPWEELKGEILPRFHQDVWNKLYRLASADPQAAGTVEERVRRWIERTNWEPLNRVRASPARALMEEELQKFYRRALEGELHQCERELARAVRCAAETLVRRGLPWAEVAGALDAMMERARREVLAR